MSGLRRGHQGCGSRSRRGGWSIGAQAVVSSWRDTKQGVDLLFSSLFIFYRSGHIIRTFRLACMLAFAESIPPQWIIYSLEVMLHGGLLALIVVRILLIYLQLLFPV